MMGAISGALTKALLLAQAAKEAPAEVDPIGEVTELWDQVVSFVAVRGFALLLNVLAAVAILVIGRWVARLLSGFARRMLERGKVEDTLTKFLVNILYALLLTFVVLAAINRLGIDTTSFAAVIAAAGLAIGFALQGSLANFAAGVMLILFKPFKSGDFVEAGGTSGIVEEINIFHTQLRTPDNIQIVLPNSQITGGTITNFSAKATRRIDLVVGCGYGDDLRAVRQYLEEVVREDDRILADPAPVVAVNELGESSVNFVVRPWVNAADYWAVRWDLTERIKLGFDQHGFNFPFPSRDLFLHQESTS